MSTWREYLEEKAKMDDLSVRGYRIVQVTELLDGDDVLFVRDAGNGQEADTVQLRLGTADGRKYMGTVLITQLQTASSAPERKSSTSV